MNKFYTALLLLLTALLSPPKAAAQQRTIDSLFSGKDSTAVMDSLVRDLDAFIKGMKDSKSFFSVNVGVGNRTFSINNNSLNTQESATDFISVMPSLGYFHKSGLGLTLTGFLSTLNGKANLYQVAVTPSYDYIGEKVSAGISYTRYMDKDTAIRSSSPYENDLYGYFNITHNKWRYGISLGFATGNFNDRIIYKDSALRKNPLTGILEMVKFRVVQNSSNSITDFSTSFSVRRDFDWYKVFSKKDYITLSLTGYLVTGSSSIQSHGNINLKAKNVTLTRIRKTFSSLNGTGYQVQSAAVSASLFYSLGKFNIQPIWFLDYYFPDSDKRWSQVFSLTLGFDF